MHTQISTSFIWKTKHSREHKWKLTDTKILPLAAHSSGRPRVLDSIRVNFDFHKINEYLNCVPCKTPPETRFAGATCSICICKRTSVSVSAFVYHRTGLAGCPPTQTYLQIYRLGDNCESHSDLAHKKLFLYWLHSNFFGISVSFLAFGRVGRRFVQIGWLPPLRSAHEWASITINKHLHS